MNNHKIDYKIYGDDMQFVEVELDPKETVVAEAGSFMMMEDDIHMETIFGDGSGGGAGAGLMGKLFSAGKRIITGESLFMTTFTNTGAGKKHVSFASPYPGKIIPMDLSELGGKIICQKDAFLAAAKGVQVGIEFQRKMGVGFFGGEGFIMQKLEGDGMCFVHAGGTIIRKELLPGQSLKVDTGCLVAMTSSVHYDIEFVKGVKTALFGGEGLFFATLRGPGSVWIQSLPFSRLASRVFAAAPSRGGAKDEGSIARGIFDMFNGD
ncbi:TIGR00266 family protein [Neobacillus cucumis]|uniref:TIGR00266 family protein n=1 Tax=Neobacillus cucumis TaxID=1740721 RepID=UPI00203FC645|nr:TIGR00266 family protein [Neobacillus cucumis]MCM3728015.1 TIGR00266 family protein [Neobacillus cucumis]